MSKVTCVITLLLAAVPSARGDSVFPHIYRVNSGKCGKNLIGYALTGFRLHGLTGIVTSLHGVIGCKAITVANPENGISGAVSIAGVDVKNDLALLEFRRSQLQRSDGYEWLPSAVWEPYAGSSMEMIGIPSATSTRRESVLVRKESTGLFIEHIPESRRTVWRERGSPDEKARTLNLQAKLGAGYSGSPIVNLKGQVVAVATGGLIDTDDSFAVELTDPRKWMKIEEKDERRLTSGDFEMLFRYRAPSVDRGLALKSQQTPSTIPVRLVVRPDEYEHDFPATRNTDWWAGVNQRWIERLAVSLDYPTQKLGIEMVGTFYRLYDYTKEELLPFTKHDGQWSGKDGGGDIFVLTDISFLLTGSERESYEVFYQATIMYASEGRGGLSPILSRGQKISVDKVAHFNSSTRYPRFPSSYIEKIKVWVQQKQPRRSML